MDNTDLGLCIVFYFMIDFFICLFSFFEVKYSLQKSFFIATVWPLSMVVLFCKGFIEVCDEFYD